MTSSTSILETILAQYPTSAVPVEAVEVRLLHLPVREALTASHGSHQVRELTVVGFHGRLESRAILGWGECAALPTASYWPETAGSSFDVLGQVLGALPGRSPLDLTKMRRGNRLAIGSLDQLPMAWAALEMAMLDLVLSGVGVSLGQALGAEVQTVPAGGTTGIVLPNIVADRAKDLHDQGFARIKLKIEPNHDVSVVQAVLDQIGPAIEQGQVVLQVDANGSYGSDPTAEQTLLRLAELGVQVIEQPFPINQPQTARSLCRALNTAGHSTMVMADEAAATVADALSAVDTGAAHGVVIKPSRLGGLSPALHLLREAATRAVPVSVGGMMESGLGRHALAAFAAIAEDRADVLIGDLAPARRWLADDPWPDVTMIEGTERAEVLVPRNPGVAPAPDLEILDRYTVKRLVAP